MSGGAGKGITVIGYDAGPPSAAARAAVDAATLVVGGARHLAAFGVPLPAAGGAQRAIILGPVAAALDALACNDGPAVVLASGDPGFFGVVRALRDAGLEPVRVIPAVSSVAAAFSRAGLSWDDALVVSTHGGGDGRELRRAANVCRAHRKVALLTGPGAGARELARELLGSGVERVLVVAQRLGYPVPGSASGAAGARMDYDDSTNNRPDGLGEHDAVERVERLTLAQAAEHPGFAEPNVVLCLDPRPRRAPKRWLAGWQGPRGPWALDESAFEYGAGRITKAEVRAQILPRLAPAVGELVWDLGAGSGSVGVECARFGAAVIAVEKDAQGCARIAANAAAHGVEVCVVQGRAPDVLPGLPRPDAVFVGGGGPGVVRAALSCRPDRIVVALASVERVGEVIRLLEADGRAVGGVLSQSSRLAELPGGTHRFAALNPVYVVWGSVE
jgi:precorrin-6Y C5,15-methyltransferase (decarboxylating)